MATKFVIPGSGIIKCGAIVNTSTFPLSSAGFAVASTITFTYFGRRERPKPALDLVNPAEIIGEDPLGCFVAEATKCREVWRSAGALDGSWTALALKDFSGDGPK